MYKHDSQLVMYFTAPLHFVQQALIKFKHSCKDVDRLNYFYDIDCYSNSLDDGRVKIVIHFNQRELDLNNVEYSAIKDIVLAYLMGYSDAGE